jgi:hypothetical protein
MIRSGIAALVLAGLMGLAFFGGHQSGAAKRDAHWLGIENSTLREQAKEIARQTHAAAQKQKEFNRAQTQINDFAVRLRNADRLRVKAEHAAAVERASAESLRAYAKGLHGLFDECRAAYGDLAAEGAGAAAAAKAMKPD